MYDATQHLCGRDSAPQTCSSAIMLVAPQRSLFEASFAAEYRLACACRSRSLFVHVRRFDLSASGLLGHINPTVEVSEARSQSATPALVCFPLLCAIDLHQTREHVRRPGGVGGGLDVYPRLNPRVDV